MFDEHAAYVWKDRALTAEAEVRTLRAEVARYREFTNKQAVCIANVRALATAGDWTFSPRLLRML